MAKSHLTFRCDPDLLALFKQECVTRSLTPTEGLREAIQLWLGDVTRSDAALLKAAPKVELVLPERSTGIKSQDSDDSLESYLARMESVSDTEASEDEPEVLDTEVLDTEAPAPRRKGGMGGLLD